MAGRQMRISKELMKEIQQDANQLKNIAEAQKMFDNFDSRLTEVGKLIERLPDSAIVRPKQNWLSIFGIEKG